MKRRKKKLNNPTLNIVKNTVAGGIGLSMGSVVVDKVGGVGNVPQAQKVASQAQGAFSLGAVALPVSAAGSVVNQTQDMFRGTKKKSKNKMRYL